MTDFALDDDTVAYLNQLAAAAVQDMRTRQASPEQSTVPSPPPPAPKPYVRSGYKRRANSAPIDWKQRKADAMAKSGYGPTSPIWGLQVEVLLEKIRHACHALDYLADQCAGSCTVDGQKVSTCIHSQVWEIITILDEWKRRLVYAEEMKDK